MNFLSDFQRRVMFYRSLLITVIGISVLSGASATPVLSESLEAALKPLISAHKGQVAVAVKNLQTGESFEYRADEPMPTASLIKFPVMIATYHAIAEGELKADKVVTLKEEDKVPGSGILTINFSDGAPLLLHDAIRLMIAYSDNTATNLVVDQIGIETTAKMMESLDCPNTKLHSKVYRGDTTAFPERSREFGLGSTTAGEMVKLFEKLHNKELVSKEFSEEMKQHLLACDDQNKIARSLPEGTKFAHKTGAVSAVRTDAGIIYGPEDTSIAICVLTSKNEDQSWNDRNEAERLCARIGRATYDHFFADEKDAASAEPQILKVGATGTLVEALQRTLNARVEPSPGISVDGDFGPQTQEAVEAFQQQQGLSVTGEVGNETWAALGTLVDRDPEAPSPEEINSRTPDKEPADSLDGEPFVTCRVWAIGDGNTGEVLWGHNVDEAVDIASTTKMMTAYVVLRMAEEDPSVLEETVTFSPKAARVIGSSSRLRAGEQVPVGELLYGLMLPSGNDASVALAEHFGARLDDGNGNESNGDDSEVSDDESYDRFIDAMNRTAKELGMDSSNYVNTHGLTAEGHKASAKDLIKLAHHAFQIPLYRKIVGTAERGGTVTGPGGYQRNVHWRNTNQLLRIEGYGGVKTGTTRAAGACLVSYGERDDRSLFTVVLGASSSDSRYTDTRNLFRWAWNELEKQSREPGGR